MRPLTKNEEAIRDINQNWAHFADAFELGKKVVGVSGVVMHNTGVQLHLRYKTRCKRKYNYEDVRSIDVQRFKEWRKLCRLYTFVKAGDKPKRLT